jgi:hypothetical protein
MDENNNEVEKQHRPFFLSILCFIVFVYSIVFITLFTFSAIFNHWISFVWHDYLPYIQIERSAILIISFVGIILYTGSFLGVLFIWKLKRVGYYIFLFASLVTGAVPFFFGIGNLISLFIFSILIIAFSFFLRILK